MTNTPKIRGFFKRPWREAPHPRPDRPVIDENPVPEAPAAKQRIGDRPAGSEPTAVISKTTAIIGEIDGREDLRLDGRVEGNVVLEGSLVIGDNCFFSGRIEAENVIVEGRVEGRINAAGRVEIRSTSRVRGNVFCQQIAIAEGAVLEGDVIHENGQSLAPSRFIEKRKDLKKEKDQIGPVSYPSQRKPQVKPPETGRR